MGKSSGFLKFSIGLAAVLVIPATAWACTGQPTVLGVNPIAAAPGEEIRLGGEAVATSPLQIHWNSATGPVVGEVTPDNQGDFSVMVTVPEARPGIYTLVLVGKAAQSAGRTALEVLPSGAGRTAPRTPVQAISADLWNGFSASEGAADEAASVAGAQSWPPSGVMMAGTALLAAGLLSLVTLGRVSRSRQPKRKAS